MWNFSMNLGAGRTLCIALTVAWVLLVKIADWGYQWLVLDINPFGSDGPDVAPIVGLVFLSIMFVPVVLLWLLYGTVTWVMLDAWPTSYANALSHRMVALLVLVGLLVLATLVVVIWGASKSWRFEMTLRSGLAAQPAWVQEIVGWLAFGLVLMAVLIGLTGVLGLLLTCRSRDPI